MLVVGLTGGIGSGKTAVSDMLQARGIEIVDADVVAREVVEPGTQALQQIQKHFGDDILLPEGGLDRAKLRGIVFADAEEKAWLENLLHPLIGNETFTRLESAQSPYVVFATPLLIETGQTSICDRIVVVDVPEETQIARTSQRDSNSEEQVKRIIASQASRDDRLAAATDVIDNSGSLEELETAVNALHEQLLALAETKQAAAHD